METCVPKYRIVQLFLLVSLERGSCLIFRQYICGALHNNSISTIAPPRGHDCGTLIEAKHGYKLRKIELTRLVRAPRLYTRHVIRRVTLQAHCMNL